MPSNEKRLILIFLTVIAAGLLFLFLNRYRFYYNYVKIVFREGEKSVVTAGENSTDIGKRNIIDGASSGSLSGKAAGGYAGRISRAGRPAGKIDINRAGLNELMSLPGVGRVTALNIIEYRARTGGFKDVRDLIGVQGIGPKKLDAVLEYVVAE